MNRFRVKRQHLGDRMYMPGDHREASPREVAHLVAAGVLEEAPAKAESEAKGKAEPPPQNKAEPAPQNKAETEHKAKKAER